MLKRRTNRKNDRLYESIMRDVSKVIKRHLNEAAPGISLYQKFLDKLESTPMPDYLDACSDSESSDTWCYYANTAKFEWLDEVAEALGYNDITELGKDICKEQGWRYDPSSDCWDELIDSCDELRDMDINYIQEPVDEMYPYWEYE